MKKRAIHIVFPFLLIANLLFSQVALSFLHNEDSEQHEQTRRQTAHTSVQQHIQHCKICSLDTLFHFLPAGSPELSNPQITAVVSATHPVDVKSINIRYAQDRAPPFFL